MHSPTPLYGLLDRPVSFDLVGLIQLSWLNVVGNIVGSWLGRVGLSWSLVALWRYWTIFMFLIHRCDGLLAKYKKKSFWYRNWVGLVVRITHTYPTVPISKLRKCMEIASGHFWPIALSIDPSIAFQIFPYIVCLVFVRGRMWIRWTFTKAVR